MAGKNPNLVALLKFQDTHHYLVELLRGSQEQFLTGINLKNLHQLLTMMATGMQTGNLQNMGDLITHNWNCAWALMINRRRIKPHDPPLTNHTPFVVKMFEQDKVRISGSMDTGAHRSLGKGEQAIIGKNLLIQRRFQCHPVKLAKTVTVRAQQTETLAGNRAYNRLSTTGIDRQFFIGEEGEVVIQQPTQVGIDFSRIGIGVSRQRFH